MRGVESFLPWLTLTQPLYGHRHLRCCNVSDRMEDVLAESSCYAVKNMAALQVPMAIQHPE